MSMTNDALFAKSLGYTREEMIAKYGVPGTKTPEEIAKAEGFSIEQTQSIFATQQSEENDTSSFGNYSITNIIDNSDDEADDTTATTLSNAASETSLSNETTETDNPEDKYKQVAEATGYDVLTVSAVMKAAATGNYNGAPENVVSQMAYDLGLPESAVAEILRYLNNGQI